MFHETGISRRGFLLMGGPQETMETVNQSLGFADTLELDSMKITVGIRIYPDTELAALARVQGIVTPEDDLLQPAFYLAPRLRDWLPDRIAHYRASRPWAV